jgi:hypothetical protein
MALSVVLALVVASPMAFAHVGQGSLGVRVDRRYLLRSFSLQWVSLVHQGAAEASKDGGAKEVPCHSEVVAGHLTRSLLASW